MQASTRRTPTASGFENILNLLDRPDRARHVPSGRLQFPAKNAEFPIFRRPDPSSGMTPAVLGTGPRSSAGLAEKFANQHPPPRHYTCTFARNRPGGSRMRPAIAAALVLVACPGGHGPAGAGPDDPRRHRAHPRRADRRGPGGADRGGRGRVRDRYRDAEEPQGSRRERAGDGRPDPQRSRAPRRGAAPRAGGRRCPAGDASAADSRDRASRGDRAPRAAGSAGRGAGAGVRARLPDARPSAPRRATFTGIQESTFVPFQPGVAGEAAAGTKPEPVYWGFGGKLRPDAWGQPQDRDRKPSEDGDKDKDRGERSRRRRRSRPVALPGRVVPRSSSSPRGQSSSAAGSSAAVPISRSLARTFSGFGFGRSTSQLMSSG